MRQKKAPIKGADLLIPQRLKTGIALSQQIGDHVMLVLSGITTE
jgi:hypothetical protein